MIWEEYRPSSKLQELMKQLILITINSRLGGEGKTL